MAGQAARRKCGEKFKFSCIVQAVALIPASSTQDLQERKTNSGINIFPVFSSWKTVTMITSKTATQLSHADLCVRAERWLLNTVKCGVVLKGLTAVTGETPAVIGWRDQHVSHLVACATTLSEFHSDRSKHYRNRSHLGLGIYRYYMCPSGLIMPDELPPKWGLLYITPTKVRNIVKAERQGQLPRPKGRSLRG